MKQWPQLLNVCNKLKPLQILYTSIWSQTPLWGLRSICNNILMKIEHKSSQLFRSCYCERTEGRKFVAKKKKESKGVLHPPPPFFQEPCGLGSALFYCIQFWVKIILRELRIRTSLSYAIQDVNSQERRWSLLWRRQLGGVCRHNTAPKPHWISEKENCRTRISWLACLCKDTVWECHLSLVSRWV